MKKQHLIPAAVIAGISLLGSGCAVSSPQTHLYVLHADLHTNIQNPVQPNDIAVVVATVGIPKQLDRPSIITQTGDNELSFSEFHRWASPLEDNLQQVLIENLAHLLHSDRITPEIHRAPYPADLRVEIRIISLSGALGQTANLQARWTLSSTAENKLIAAETFREEIDLTGETYLDYVVAHNILQNLLAQDIADTIRNYSRQGSAHTEE
jgi:uncharacterized lipoprotein YmbA